METTLKKHFIIIYNIYIINVRINVIIFIHINVTWNLVNSSARSSSLASINLTTCCGNKVNEPRFKTSLPCSSTNSRTLKEEKIKINFSYCRIYLLNKMIFITHWIKNNLVLIGNIFSTQQANTTLLSIYKLTIK